MVWFKVDDGLAFHAKTVAAGNAAMGLWVRAGAWSAQHLTDGAIPGHIAAMLGTPQQAAKLVRAGLWDEASDGFSFHEWDERQPKKEAIEDERAAARERMRINRDRRKGTTSASAQVSESGSPELPRTVTAAFANPDPTRPDPTYIQNSTSSVEPANAGAQPDKVKRATRLPASWKPTDDHRERARTTSVDIDREVMKFRTHAEDKGRTSKSWNAAFTQWLIKAAEYAQRDGVARQTVNGRPVRSFGNDQWMANQ